MVTFGFKQTSANLLDETKVKMFELGKISFSRFPRSFKFKNLKNADRAEAREIDNMFELARISFKRFVRNFKFENLKIIECAEASVARITGKWFSVAFRRTLCYLSHKTWGKTILGMKRFAQSQMRDDKCRTGKSFKYGIAHEEESSRRKSRTFKYTAARTVELNSESKEGKTPGRSLKNASAIGYLSQPSGCVRRNH